MERLELPHHLRGVFFDWLWETTKVWSLPTSTCRLPFGYLKWHLGLTVWTTVRASHVSTLRQQPSWRTRHATLVTGGKSKDADLSYPLELFRHGKRWVILDGYHRLAGHSVRRNDQVPVRLHSDEYRDLIRPESQR